MKPTSLLALVLAGGAGRRMGADKAALLYRNEPLVRRLARMLEMSVGRVHVSVRRDQIHNPVFDGLDLLPDLVEGIGPLGGLLSAFGHEPHSAWLVTAVDMPWVTEGTFRRLVDAHDPRCLATAYMNPATGDPEPVLAIYEPAILPVLEHARASGRYSLMLLKDLPVRLLEPESERELFNVNDPMEYSKLQETINGKRLR